MRIGGQVPGLSAVQIGVKAETAVIEALQQHHPYRRPAVGIGGGEAHRVRIVGLAAFRLGEPDAKLREGIVVKAHAGSLLNATGAKVRPHTQARRS